MLCSGGHLCAETVEKPYFKRFSGIEKAHRNSIKITVDLWRRVNDLVWELVERKNSEDIHKAELPEFLFRVVDFMECRTEWVGTATELLTEMKEQEVTPNMITKYLGQFAYEVLEPLGIEYRTKRTGKSRLIKFLRRDGDDANDAGIAI